MHHPIPKPQNSPDNTRVKNLHWWCQPIHGETRHPDWQQISGCSPARYWPMTWHTMSNRRWIKKCLWSDFHPTFDPNRNPSIQPKSPQDPTLYLTNPDNSKVPLQCTISTEGIRHLGIHISMDSNSTAETKVLYKWCQLFCKVYQRFPLTCKEALIIYQTIFLPTLTYPFPATTLPIKTLDQAQSLTTPTILSKIEFNCNMPKAIVYTPISHGGIGFQNLHNEQGVQQILQILKHMRTQTTLGMLITTTIEAYQITAGICKPILKSTGLLPWMPHWWINNVQEYLHKIEGTIKLKSPWTILPFRTNDHYLMTDFLSANLLEKTLQTLNNCWMYLKVTTLVELSDHTGRHLLPTACLQGKIVPDLQTISISLFTWPNQEQPHLPAWRLWTKILKQIYTKPGIPYLLKTPLGPWTHHAPTQRQWHTMLDPITRQLLNQSNPQALTTAPPTTMSTRSYTYTQQLLTTAPTYHFIAPVTPQTHKNITRINLPVNPFPSPPLLTTTPLTNELTTTITQSLPNYDIQLWQSNQHNPTHSRLEMAQQFQTATTPFYLISNASLNHNQHSAFAWIIANSNQELWRGEGTVPGATKDTHSGCLEGFGILAAIIFLDRYLRATHQTSSESSTWQVFCRS